ncbi:hypothetical protein MMC25_007908 [Agyrium rufum]|nr:hypothetical protein [Agyrium rufum]
MSVSIGHLDSIADLALGLLSNLASSNEGTNLPTVPRGKQTNDSVAAKRPRSLSSTSGTEGSISDFLIGLAIPDGKEDLYGVPIGERAISHTLYQPQTSPTSSEEPSPLVSWLYLVRYALSVTVRDYRADLALSHSFRLAKALVFGVGATFLVRRWIRDRGDPDLAIKIVRPCKREEEDNILRAVGVEMKTLTNSSLVENEYIVRLKAVDWEVRMGYQHPLPILIMECAEFGDLAGYQKRPLTLRFQTKLELCLDVALGIRALHAYGFIHGDLKSENVLLFHHPKRGFIAKLSDFAFSALPTYKGEKRRLAGKSFPYNAPETDHDSESTALDFADLSLTDVYSLGMLVWRTMLDGKNPFTVDPESHEVIKVPSTREIARRKLSGILIEEASGQKGARAHVKENLFKETPLHWVSAFSNEDDIEFFAEEFMARGADISKYGGSVSTQTMDTHAKAEIPLERAVSRNNPMAVKVILKIGDDPESMVTPKICHTAAIYHFSECLELLLKARPMADSIMDHRNLLGSAILGAPIWQWYHWHGLSYKDAANNTLEILKDAQVDTTKVITYVPYRHRFESQLSAMGAVAVVGADYMIDFLASRGVSVTAQVDPYKYDAESPPLYEAIARGYYDAAESLLRHGADPNVRWLWIGGQNYLHLCAYYHWNLTFVRLLVEQHKANIDIIDEHGRIPLYTVLLAQNFPFVDYMLERGASKIGRPAGQSGFYNLFGELLSIGAGISDQQLECALKFSSGGFQVALFGVFSATALHIACSPYPMLTN